VRKLWTLGVFFILTLTLCVASLHAANTKLGKLYIKVAPVADGQFTDPELQDTVKDMKSRSGHFDVVTNESEADYLIVVMERMIDLRSPAGTPQNYKHIVATLSVRDGDKWKPAIKLTNTGFTGGASWGVAASKVIEEAEKWVKANPQK
jgi:hypothetical protein